MHALIIEDEPLIAMTIEDGLRDCGFTSFDFAVSHMQAVSAARAKCPDLITADVDLNPSSGIEAVTEICGGPSIPVLFVTGSHQQVSEMMPDHPLLKKTFTIEQLIFIVRVTLSNVDNIGKNVQKKTSIISA